MEPQIIRPTEPTDVSQPTAPATMPTIVGTQPAAVTTTPPQAMPVGFTTPIPAAPIASQSQSIPIQPAPVKHKKGKTMLLAASGLAVIAIFIGGGLVAYSSFSKSNATKQAQQFVFNLNKGDNKLAYAMGSKSLQQDQTEAQFTDALGDLTAANPSFDKQTTNVTGSHATYVAFEDGLPADADGNTQGTFTISLVKSGLVNWKIDSIAVQ